jgi:hypothetical protein
MPARRIAFIEARFDGRLELRLAGSEKAASVGTTDDRTRLDLIDRRRGRRAEENWPYPPQPRLLPRPTKTRTNEPALNPPLRPYAAADDRACRACR